MCFYFRFRVSTINCWCILCLFALMIFYDFNNQTKPSKTFLRLVPGAPPRNITAEATSPTTIALSWEPPVERSNGRIIYYKVFLVENGGSDNEASVTTLKNATSIVLDELKRWTEYKIWVLAGTSVGDGPKSNPMIVRTHEDGMYPLFYKLSFDYKSYLFRFIGFNSFLIRLFATVSI